MNKEKMGKILLKLKKGFKRFLPYTFLVAFLWILSIYIYHLVLYRPLGFYFFDPVKNTLVKESISYPLPLRDPQKQLEKFFYEYEKGPENYLLKNVFLHGNSVESVFIYKNELNINFYSHVIVRLKDANEEKNLIDGILMSLKDQKNIKGSTLYSALKGIDKVTFTFGGYPFKVIKGAYTYDAPFNLQK